MTRIGKLSNPAALRRSLQLGALLGLGVGYLRHRHWRVRDVALRSRQLARARGISAKVAGQGADPRITGIW